MSNQITIDDKELLFDETFLPCLVTGAHKSWASYFSVSLIANLIQQWSKVIFFTAFPMAKEELLHQIGNNKTFEVRNESDIKNIPQDKSILIESGNKELWEKVIQNIGNLEEYIVFVKNIEEYDKLILEIIWDKEKIILSGTIDSCSFKENISKKQWESMIIFTAPEIDLNVQIPSLEKYESYLINKNLEGVLRIKGC